MQSHTTAPSVGFRYHPLLDRRRHIRLLSLFPGKPRENVCCSLQHIPLDDHPDYEAISYCWGDETDTVPIICNGVVIVVTRSLQSALRHFRYATRARTLWADAICIDQINPQEKTHQVALMRDIYQQANRVLSWLGEEANGSEQVPSLVSRINREAKSLPGAGLLMLGNQTNLSEDAALKLVMGRLPPKHHNQWEAFRLLLRRPWFSRIWIVQEVAVASAIEIHCGDARLDLNELANAVWFSASSGYVETERNSGVSALMSLHVARIYAQTGQRKPLLSLLLQFAAAKASKPKDKVYALLGLSDSDLVPDFALDVVEAYKVAAVDIITSASNLDLLSFPRGECANRNINLPSWVPDWESINQRIQQLTMQDFGGAVTNAPHFLASSDQTTIMPLFADKNQMIRLEGRMIDEIEAVADGVQPHETPRSAELDLELQCRTHRCLISWEHTAKAWGRDRYVTGESMIDAYWQTLQGGWAPRGHEFHRNIYNRHLRQFAIRRYLHEHGVPSAVLRLPETVLRQLGIPRYSHEHGAPCAVLLLPETVQRQLFNPEMLALLSPTSEAHVSHQFYGYCRPVVNRRLIRSKTGYIGLAPQDAEPGDKIYVVKGSRIPLVLRPAAPRHFMQRELNTHPLYELVGDAYVHGIMFGEKFSGKEECETFWLV
jgi:Heterokaryon incompatibility protein (HET)